MTDTMSALETIKGQVSQALRTVIAKTGDVRDARDVLNGASEAASSERENILVNLAKLANDQDWQSDQISLGVKSAVAERNDIEKWQQSSVNTFASEIRRATGPKVRAHVSRLFALTKAAFDQEAEARKADKDAPQPLRQAFIRRYHATVNVAFKMCEEGTPPADVDALIAKANAVIRERQTDYNKVHARLQAIRAQLQSFAADFPVDGLAECDEFLREITVDALKKCVPDNAKINSKVDPRNVLADALPDDQPEGQPEPTREDLLDDALNDIAADIAA